MIADKHL